MWPTPERMNKMSMRTKSKLRLMSIAHNDDDEWIFGLSNGLESTEPVANTMPMTTYLLDEFDDDDEVTEVAYVLLNERNYGDWGNILVGIRFCNLQRWTILEVGDMDEDQPREVALEPKERIVGVVSRTHVDYPTTHFDVKFLVGRMI